jgi:hypothetical protein
MMRRCEADAMRRRWEADAMMRRCDDAKLIG